jgi:hypothetical protein
MKLLEEGELFIPGLTNPQLFINSKQKKMKSNFIFFEKFIII